MRPNVNTQTALTLPGPIPLQKGVGPGNEASDSVSCDNMSVSCDCMSCDSMCEYAS